MNMTIGGKLVDSVVGLMVLAVVGSLLLGCGFLTILAKVAGIW